MEKADSGLGPLPKSGIELLVAGSNQRLGG